MIMPDTFLVVCLVNGHDYCYHSRLGTSSGCHSLLRDSKGDSDDYAIESESDNLGEGTVQDMVYLDTGRIYVKGNNV
jgi:hypothetical protein